jgi:hypothetical protein
MLSKKTIDFLDLLFDPGESVCVSPNKYAYYSVTLDQFKSGQIQLINKSKNSYHYKSNAMELISINPISGWREDANVTKFRSFLVEIDDGSLSEQLSYIKDLKVPYSACVFSGSKSLHFAITLDTPFESLSTYKYVAEWILNIVKKADQNTKNPSRGIRIPGAIRSSTKKEQKLIELKSRITMDELNAWLSEYEEFKPKPIDEDVEMITDLGFVPLWVVKKLEDGIHNKGSRNSTWYIIAHRIAEAGLNEDEAVSVLSRYYEEQPDFTRREWEYVIRNTVKKYRNK